MIEGVHNFRYNISHIQNAIGVVTLRNLVGIDIEFLLVE